MCMTNDHIQQDYWVERNDDELLTISVKKWVLLNFRRREGESHYDPKNN